MMQVAHGSRCACKEHAPFLVLAEGGSTCVAVGWAHRATPPYPCALSQGRQMSEEEMRAANPLLMLLQSFLPWFGGGQQPDYDREGGDGGGGGAPPAAQG